MSFLVALGLLVGLISGGLSIYEFAKSRRLPGAFLGILAVGILLGAFFLGNVSSLLANNGRDVGLTPTTSIQETGTSSSPTQGSPTQAPAQIPSPTPTSPPGPGTVLYQADSSWNGWSGSPDWKILNGMLINDGTSNTQEEPTILAPYQLGGITNYAVEATIQVVNWQQCCIAEFGIIVRASTNSYGSWQGYTIGDVINSFAGPQYVAEISSRAGEFGGSLGTAPFAPGNASHTYRIELRGNDIKFIIDGGIKLHITDNTYLSGGQVGFWSFDVQLNITSFKIIAL